MEHRKEQKVTLYMSELIYDIQNKTYLTGRSRRDGSNHALVASMQANDDDEDNNQIIRSIDEAYASLKSHLSEYMISEAASDNNVLNEPETIEINLTMPSNYNPAALEAITKSCHQYIVNMATGDWFTITNKADAEVYYAKGRMNLAALEEAINRRVRPIRKIGG